MSEYQYYEFRAMDRRLDKQAMADLRSISSRAEITPTSMVNVYNHGDFRSNVERLMETYFDAHLYVANWGTHRLLLRLPARSIDVAVAELYEVPDVFEVRPVGEHVILR